MLKCCPKHPQVPCFLMKFVHFQGASDRSRPAVVVDVTWAQHPQQTKGWHTTAMILANDLGWVFVVWVGCLLGVWRLLGVWCLLGVWWFFRNNRIQFSQFSRHIQGFISGQHPEGSRLSFERWKWIETSQNLQATNTSSHRVTVSFFGDYGQIYY